MDKNMKKVQSLVMNEYIPKNPSDEEIKAMEKQDAEKQETANRIPTKHPELLLNKSPYSKKLKRVSSAYIRSSGSCKNTCSTFKKYCPSKGIDKRHFEEVYEENKQCGIPYSNLFYDVLTE